jgi:hypothetical protein
MKYLQKYNKFNEDVQIDKSNLQRLKDHFDPYLDDMSSKYNKDIEQIFNDKFINTISNLCLELDDLGYQVSIRFPQYHKERQGQFAETMPCLCVDIDSLPGNFINNKAIEMTVKEIQSYVSDFNLSVDIELGSDDQFVTADEFITTYNVEELDFISIIIY